MPPPSKIVYGKRQTRPLYSMFSSPLKSASPTDVLPLEDKENDGLTALTADMAELKLLQDGSKFIINPISKMQHTGRTTLRTRNANSTIYPMHPDSSVKRDRNDNGTDVPHPGQSIQDVTSTPMVTDAMKVDVTDKNARRKSHESATDENRTASKELNGDSRKQTSPSIDTTSTTTSSSAICSPDLPAPTVVSLSSRPRSTIRKASSILDTILAEHASSLLILSNEPGPSPTPFADWTAAITPHFSLTKIAEASYGEVYRLSSLRPDAQFPRSSESVLKLIALKPPGPLPASTAGRARIAAMSAVADVASEVRLLRLMTPVPGFTNFRDVRVVQGRPPAIVVEAWRAFDRNVRKSEFADPGKKSTYKEDQLWSIVEMQDAGVDLEGRVVKTVFEAWDVFWGVACALAKGEEFAGYEHRDLHLGNICVRWPSPDPLTCETGCSTPALSGRKLGFTGLETTIIDYTLSRADMPDGLSPAFLDLARDASLFEGDGSVEYQYDMYRYMRAAVLYNDPLAPDDSSPMSSSETSSKKSRPAGPPWSAYRPLTNLVWLHFVLYMLFKTVEWPSNLAEDTTVLGVGRDLEDKLRTLSGLLELKRLNPSERIWESSGMLVAWVVEQQWLDKEDVIELSSGRSERGKRKERRRKVGRAKADKPQ